MIYKILIDKNTLADRDMYMMMHPSKTGDDEMVEGDVIELQEGFFILNDDLNPMERATDEQIEQARFD